MQIPKIPKEKILPVAAPAAAIVGALFVGLFVDILREIAAVAIIRYGHNFFEAASKYRKEKPHDWKLRRKFPDLLNMKRCFLAPCFVGECDELRERTHRAFS